MKRSAFPLVFGV
jgi:hypothetical protein